MITPNTLITSSDVAGHYDDLDFYYRSLWGEHVHHGLWQTGRESSDDAVLRLIDYLADKMVVTAGDRVCDVGCGYGGTARYLAEQRQLNVTGLTISPAQHEYASGKTSGGNPTYLLRNWENNCLPESSFDGLVSIECLAHVEDKSKYFAEVRRVLKPGRRAVITAWLSGDAPSPRQQQRLLEPICREGRLPSMGTEADYNKLIDDVGLRVVAFEDLSGRVAKTWRICQWRIAKTLMTSPAAWRFLARRETGHAVFLLTVWRIQKAYRIGAMRYGLFVLETPDAP